MREELVSPELKNTDEEYRELARQHQEFEARLTKLTSLSYPTEEEILEESLLKKKKLLLKDKMEAIMHRYKREAEITRFKEALRERVTHVAGLHQVYVEVLPEEVRVLSILDRDTFDEASENPIYDIHYDFLELFDLPMRFLCLPRTAVQAGIPGIGAEPVFSKE